MTRFVVDAGAVLRIIEEDIRVAPEHELLAPTLVRSQVLSRLHEAVARGELSDATGRERHEAFGRIRIRLLGDAVLRRVAWRVADRLGSASTYDAEYIALTQLQADALVTTDDELARAAAGLVDIASVEHLSRRSGARPDPP